MILPRGKEGFGGFEADRLRDRILSTQRFRRGRGRDFIYTKNVARPRFVFYLRNEFRAAGVRFDLHKERRAGEIWILSTQRVPRGRGPMFISINVLWGVFFLFLSLFFFGATL